MWDTAGQERFRNSLGSAYYRNVDAVILVYDVTNKTSFDNLRYWMSELQKNFLHDIPRLLVGNKCDMQAVVNRSEALKFADENGMLVSR